MIPASIHGMNRAHDGAASAARNRCKCRTRSDLTREYENREKKILNASNYNDESEQEYYTDCLDTGVIHLVGSLMRCNSSSQRYPLVVQELFINSSGGLPSLI